MHYEDIYKKAAEARIFLHVHGFTAESENLKIWKRIDNYGQKMKVGPYGPVKQKSPINDDSGNKKTFKLNP
jgi:hypothetical protein